MDKILITGATGHLGGLVIDHLLKKTEAAQLVALARDPGKAESIKAKGIDVRIGDYNDQASLTTAFQGIDKLYFVSSDDLVKREDQHTNVVNAAKEAGVKHIFYTGFEYSDQPETSPVAIVGKSHTYTNKLLAESGLNYTILRQSMYLEFVPNIIGDVEQTSTIYYPSGDGKTAFLSRFDMSEVAANLLTSTGHENKSYSIVGSAAYSFDEIAAIVSKAIGKPVTFVSPSVEEYIQTLTGAGVPAEFAQVFAAFAGAAKEGEFEVTNPQIADLLGREPESLPDFLQQFYSKA